MLEIVFIALLSGLTTFVGVLLATCCTKTKKLASVGIGFSSGVMISISFFELFPLAISEADELLVLAVFATGFLVVWSFDFLYPHIHFIKESAKKARELKTGHMVALGLIIHDFPEGFAMATAFMVNPLAGTAVAIGIGLHNIPEEFALGIPLVMAKKKKELFWLAFLSALAEPAGALMGLALFAWVPALNPLMLAFAAGAMIFVSLDELLPLAQRYGGMDFASLGLLFGMVSYAALSSIITGF
ncbi:MAG: ZIP family metal transporter [Candidatus Diapherotrites archaeon]|nr:ZIP family metal transporter [Candidatus Diapherotrites archaeon]